MSPRVLRIDHKITSSTFVKVALGFVLLCLFHTRDVARQLYVYGSFLVLNSTYAWVTVALVLRLPRIGPRGTPENRPRRVGSETGG